MNEPPPPEFINTLVHLQYISHGQAGKIMEEFEPMARMGFFFSLSQFLIMTKNFTKGHIDQATSLLRQGYYHCNACKMVYPLPPGQRAQKRSCPRCQSPLGFCQSSSHHDLQTPLNLSEAPGENLTLGIEGLQMPQPSPISPQELRRADSPKYPILKTLGVGGFGQVYQVQDSLTGRKMALKILKPEASRKVNIQQRFLREIQITSNLEHPSIMPVYESGYLEDGSLYFVMKELRGGTLKDLMEQRKMRKKEAPTLRELLEILLKVCDALEYAHSRGIVHRDLKPSNVAVGNFGEVIVLDWGIAKAVGIDEPEEENLKENTETIEIEGQTLTMEGMLGTPGYMAPEQAKGQEATHRSDLHAMGAILYQILSHRLPYEGTLSAMLVQLISKDPLAPHELCPHLDIPRELSAIALKCLEKNPSDRYQTIREFRDDIVRYIDGFSVSARRDSLPVALSKWVRRNKALAGGLAFAVVAVVASLWIMSAVEKGRLYQSIQIHLQTAEKILATKGLLTAKDLEKKYHREYKLNRQETIEAQKERQRDLKIYMSARKELEQAYELDKSNQAIQQQLYSTEKTIGELALLGANYLLAETSFEKCAKLNPEKGKALLALLKSQKKEVEEAHLKRLSEIMSSLESNLPGPGVVDEHITEIVRMGKPEVVKGLLAYVNSPHLWQRKVVIQALGKMGDRHTMHQNKDVVEHLISRLDFLSVRDHLEECEILIWALGRLRDGRANHVANKKRWESGENSNFWDKTKLPFSWIPEQKGKAEKTFSEWLDSGDRKLSKGLYREAIADFTHAIGIHPQSVPAYDRRGNAYHRLKEYQKAIADFSHAINLDPQSASTYNNRGNTYNYLGEYQKALEDFSQAIKLNPQFAEIYNNRAIAYSGLKEYRKAIEDFSQAIRLNSQFAGVYSNRGNAYKKLKEYQKAIEDYTRAIEFNPQTPGAYSNRGDAYNRLRDYSKALGDCNQAIKLNPQYADAYHIRGNTYSGFGDYSKALADYTQAIELNSQYADAYNNRGILYNNQGEYQKALADCNQAIKLEPQFAGAYANRGIAYNGLGEHQKALADCNQAIKLDPQFEEVYNNRGVIYAALKEYEKSVVDFTRVIELNPQNASAYVNRALCWIELKKKSLALKDLKMALKINPLHPQASQIQQLIQEYEGKKD